MKFNKFLLKFPGFLRTAASVVASAAALGSVIPALLPYQEALVNLAGWLGGLGVARAGARVVAQ